VTGSLAAPLPFFLLATSFEARQFGVTAPLSNAVGGRTRQWQWSVAITRTHIRKQINFDPDIHCFRLSALKAKPRSEIQIKPHPCRSRKTSFCSSGCCDS